VDVDFSQASHLETLAPGRFAWQVPDGWQQGRGAFGGLVLAAPAARDRAQRARPRPRHPDPDRRPVRPGAARPARDRRRDPAPRQQPQQPRRAADPERRGPGPRERGAQRPAGQRGAPTRTPPAAPGLGRAGRPRHAPARWPRCSPRTSSTARPPRSPFAGADGTRGWLRPRTPLARLDAPALIAMLDAWWPAIFAIEGRPRPVATVSFTAELLRPLASLAGRLAAAARRSRGRDQRGLLRRVSRAVAGRAPGRHEPADLRDPEVGAQTRRRTCVAWPSARPVSSWAGAASGVRGGQRHAGDAVAVAWAAWPR
jgi:hypothetical protein